MKTKKVAFLGLFISLAMILSYIESQIPALVAVPGVKVGLPNIVMVLLLYKIGAKETVTVSIIRIILISMLFGSIQTLTFSIAGAVLSLLGMILLKKTDLFSCITVSIVGGILHNVGQIIAVTDMSHNVAQNGENERRHNGNRGNRPFLPGLAEEDIICDNAEECVCHGEEEIIAYRFGNHNHPFRYPIPFDILEICHAIQRSKQKYRQIRDQIKE